MGSRGSVSFFFFGYGYPIVLASFLKIILSLFELFWHPHQKERMRVSSVAKSHRRPHGLQPARFLYPGDFPGKNIGLGCHFLLRGIFLTEGSKPCLQHWQVGSLPLRPQGGCCLPIGESNPSLPCNRQGYSPLY